MAIVRKIDGVWILWTGVNEPFSQTVTTATLNYADGRQEPVEVPPYEIEVLLSAVRVDEMFPPEKLALFDLARVVPFVVPEGKRRVGERRFEETGTPGLVAEMFDVEDLPPAPPEPTPAERADRLAAQLRALGVEPEA